MPDGNVGIGTSSPGYELDVTGIIRASARVITPVICSPDNTNVIYVNNSSYVGIGTSSPNEKLEVAGSVKVGNLKIQNANGGRIGFNRNTTNGVIYDSNYSAHQINGAYSGANYLDIQSYSSGGTYQGSVVVKAGSVGIGTTTPDASMKLHVNGNIAAGTNDWYYFGGVTNGIGCTSGADMLNFKTGNSIKMSLTGGSLGIGTQYPTDSLHIFKTEGGVGAAHATIKLGGYSNTGIKIQAYRDTGNSNDQGLIIQTHNTSGYTERMRIDSSGNMGIGVIPESWAGGYVALDIGYAGTIFTRTTNTDTAFGNNFYTGSGGYTYKNNDTANMMLMLNGGGTEFRTAISAAADSPISWTTAMKIENDGKVKLNHGGNLKLHTAVNGIGITGNIDGSSDGAVGWSLFSDWAGMQLAVTTNHHLGFKTSNAERMRIDPDGYVSLTKSIKLGDDGRSAATAGAGTLRWNGGKLQSSDGTDWFDISPASPYLIDYLVIAGGAGGGYSEHGHDGGGGGAGGYRNSYNGETSGGSSTSETAFSATPGSAYNITVGSGGAGSSAGGTTGGSGNPSSFGTITSIGGGGGGAGSNGGDNRNGLSGGSGGGSGSSDQGPRAGGDGTSGQGHNGASGAQSSGAGGAGGGAGGVGYQTAANSSLQEGGLGLASSITGSSITRAIGGGVVCFLGDGSANFGEGGAGGYSNYSCPAGFAGGSGVVILRMPTSSYTGTTTGGPSVTTSGADTILVYNSSGSYTG